MLPICRRCQLTIFPDISRQSALQYTSRRLSSGGGQKQKARPKGLQENSRWTTQSSHSSTKPRTTSRPSFSFRKSPIKKERTAQLDPDDIQSIIQFFRNKAITWTEAPHVQQRLIRFGVPKQDVQILLRIFRIFAEEEEPITPEAYHRYAMVRFAKISHTDIPSEYYDMIMTTIFYAWATDTTPLPSSKYPTREAHLTSLGVSPNTLKTMSVFRQATSKPYLADRYPSARLMSRKIIMHVGPTNSGKTHNALRALAAAERGIYAGPLRLLAHEIWERLNTGKIVPLGIEEKQVVKNDEGITAAALNLNLDGASPLPFEHSSTSGSLKYTRTCNMITGEERRIVSEDAKLVSCTVEMMVTGTEHDVAVIDEIQMIADAQRGYAWTEALLSIQAKEVHLCGEDTAVPIVQELLKGTNDDLVVNRYERLTPLTVEEKSLDGNFSNVQKGDCIVAFSRSRIFDLKRKVEKKTGMKCAVVYGQLPSELRSRQADLFNDPGTGYDVIIGSDAIGMGLNLKIRRVVFDSMVKWSGETMRPLSISQTKQIAGRAGRYGLGSEGGFVTTLYSCHLEALKKTLTYPTPPLRMARYSGDLSSLEAISRVLPSRTKLEMNLIMEVHRYTGILGGGFGATSPGWVRYVDDQVIGQDGTTSTILDRLCDSVAPPSMTQAVDESDISAMQGSSIVDKCLISLAPIPYRIQECRMFWENLVKKFLVDYRVSAKELLELPGEWFLEALNEVEADMEPAVGTKKKKIKPVRHAVLSKLETFHRVLGLYNWFALRQPLAFFDTETIENLKPRVEKALQWALSSNTLVGGSKRVARGDIRGEMEVVKSGVAIDWVRQARSVRTSTAKTVIRAKK
ncbi:P-loop containing nucleoside triphosphate hydrolase protein [Marasmius fiardii PR-910]|nr:P-loop containing nucleoside triphosphate hydrolase protein [Marasmius fiardii PR-910]